VDLVHLEIARSRCVCRKAPLRTAPIAVVIEAIVVIVLGLGSVHLLEKIFAQSVALGVNFVFVDPFVLQLVPKLKHLDLNLALPIMLKDGLVRLSLAVSKAVEVVVSPARRIRRTAVARLQMRKTALDIT